MEHYTLQIVAAADFRLTQALYRFTLSSYRGREGRQVNQSLARGTSQISAINQSLSFRAGSEVCMTPPGTCRAANLRSRMPRKVPHGYSRHANIDHASPSRKRYAKAKRGACLPIAGYSQRCFARRSLSRRPRSVMDAAGPSSVERSCIHARGEDLAVFRSRWPPIPRCASDTRREFITKLARRTRFWPDKSVMANFSSRMPLKRCFNPPLALQVRRLRQIGWSVRRRSHPIQ